MLDEMFGYKFVDGLINSTYIVLSQVRVVPLDAIVQDGDHHILASVAPLPGCLNVHL